MKIQLLTIHRSPHRDPYHRRKSELLTDSKLKQSVNHVSRHTAKTSRATLPQCNHSHEVSKPGSPMRHNRNPTRTRTAIQNQRTPEIKPFKPKNTSIHTLAFIRTSRAAEKIRSEHEHTRKARNSDAPKWPWRHHCRENVTRNHTYQRKY